MDLREKLVPDKSEPHTPTIAPNDFNYIRYASTSLLGWYYSLRPLLTTQHARALNSTFNYMTERRLLRKLKGTYRKVRRELCGSSE